MPQLIIGLGYRARSGKDTVGEYLVHHHGFTRIAFADAIRDIASLLTGEDAYDLGFKERACVFDMTGGHFMQRLTILREIDPNIFVKAALPKIMSAERAVITDCRFLNEEDAIRKLGGQLWRVDRPGLPTDLHISEQEGRLIGWDMILNNSSGLTNLYVQVDAFIESALREHHARSFVAEPDTGQGLLALGSSAETAGAEPPV